jgi:phosphatidylglycerophosphate synthase
MPLNPANVITVSRIALVPVMLLLAWRRHDDAFLACLVAALLSDIADGQIARRFNLATPLGAKLDSWADFLTFCSVPFAAYWLLPEVIATQKPAFLLTIASYLLPIAIGFIKFRALTSYHTRLARIAAYLMGLAAVILFAHGPALLFQIAVGVLMIAGLEEIAITLVLPEPQSNVTSLSRVLRQLRARRQQI